MSKQKVLALPTFNSIGVTEESNGKVVIIRLNLAPEEYEHQTESVKKMIFVSEAEKKEIHRYLNLDALTKRVIDAFVVSNNALYFDDSSDYQTALWEICDILNPTQDEHDYIPQFINKRGL